MPSNILHDSRGENKNQLLIICDKKGHPLGKDTRENCHLGEGRPHLAFMAFVVNSKKEILLTKRSKEKSLWALHWDAAAISHVLPGETPSQAAARRAGEELGIKAQFKDIGAFYYTAPYNGNSENEYCHIMLTKSDERIESNPVEISEIQYVSVPQLNEMIKVDPGRFAPWFLLAMEKIDLPAEIDKLFLNEN